MPEDLSEGAPLLPLHQEAEDADGHHGNDQYPVRLRHASVRHDGLAGLQPAHERAIRCCHILCTGQGGESVHMQFRGAYPTSLRDRP